MLLYYVVPEKYINPIYSIEHMLCWLIIALIIVVSLFEMRRIVRIGTTLLSAIIVILHYYLLYILSRYESVTLYPLIIVEGTVKGSTFMIDYGQIIVLGLIYIWRNKILQYVRGIVEKTLLYIRRI